MRSLLLLILCGSAVSSAWADEPFPTESLQPRAETGVLRFLEQHPEYDGRGVVVAIFDTGVDPGAPGLQVTTDGQPKIVDLVDGTGSGDVDTTTVAQSKDGKLTGLTGRTLSVDPAWPVVSSGDFRLGMKRAYDFFPVELVERLRKERRREFDLAQRRTEARLRGELAAWKTAHPDPDDAAKLWQRELEERIEQLLALDTSYEDPGPLFDCVLFDDGEHWRVIVDTDEDGDLAEEVVLTNFRVDRTYATFPFGSLLNFAVNVYDDGDRLSLVVDAGDHGTHVAGIVAAHYPDEPERNGVAPGARIVSVKIGDTRLGSMETEAGLVRGVAAVLRNDCDAVNMSYGEPTSTPNRGRLVETFSELVDEHGVVFVASAGNAGPALSTVGAPGGTTSALIGVGAYVSPELARSAYALREPVSETAYTWTSQGPTTDGDTGVDVFAPGGAVSPVPKWTLQPWQRMNGTSMASPNACGNVALLLSAAKANELAVTPYAVKRALQNTARPVEAVSPTAQGAGLIQVDRAWEHLQAHAGAVGEGLRYDVRVGDDAARGILLREPHESRQPWAGTVRIRPSFPTRTPKEQIASFEQRLRLKATEAWVECGEFLVLGAGRGEMEVRVDPVGLPPGVHFASVTAVDVATPDRGPVCRIPVCVVVPEEVPANGVVETTRAESTAATVHRRFFAVSRGATWAEVELLVPADAGVGERTFVTHAVQLAGGVSFEEHELRTYSTIRPGGKRRLRFAVVPGRTLEVCIAQYWSSLGEGPVEYEVRFGGLVPDDRAVVLGGGAATATVSVSNAFGRARLRPKAELTTVRRVLSPRSKEHTVLDVERYRMPSGQPIQELRLHYALDVPSAGKFVVRVPGESGLLYDGETGGYVVSVHTADGRRFGFVDVFSEPVELEKGPHELVLRFRHHDPAVLKRREKTVLQVDRTLTKPVSLRTGSSRVAVRSGESKNDTRWIASGASATVVVAAPAELPKGVRSGDVLVGRITYGSDDDRSRPGGFPLEWVTPGPPASEEKSNEEVTELTVGDTATRERLLELDTTAKRKKHLPEIVSLCDELLATIDRDALAAKLGVRADPHDAESKAVRKRAESLRDQLADLLYRKGRALGYMELPDVVAEHPVEDPAALDRDFEANFRELAKWVDTTDEKWVLLHVRRDRRRERYGLALEQLNERIEKSPPNYWYVKKRRDVYESLGWTHALEAERRWLNIRFPKNQDPL